MSNFQKISELSKEDRAKLKDYFAPLWGVEFTDALTTDFTPEGKKKKVKAEDNTNIKK